MNSRRPKVKALNNEAQKLINSAHRYWAGRSRSSYKKAGNNFGRVTENNRRLYTNIRGSPTVTFTSDAQMWSFLKKFGYNRPSNILHYVSNTGTGARIPKHRKLYIMPWIFVPGPKSILNSRSTGSDQLALYNKAIVNKFITERSLKQPHIPAGTPLTQVRSFIRATNKMENLLRTVRRKEALTHSLRQGLRKRKYGIQNEVSLNYFGNKNVAYRYMRDGRIPVYYFPSTLKGLIRTRHKNINNLNTFLSNVNKNTVLYRDPGSRANVKVNNIQKVILNLPR